MSQDNTKLIDTFYTICVQNLIYKYKNRFVCSLCETSAGDSNILKHAENNNKHSQLKKIKKIGDVINNLKINETDCMKIVVNGAIILEQQNFYCFVCRISIKSFKLFQVHISSDNHIPNLASTINPIQLIYKCQTCELVIKWDDQYEIHKMFHLSPERHACPNIDIINFSIQKDKTRYIYCSLCNEILYNEEEFKKHLKSVKHCKWIYLLKCTAKFSLDEFSLTHFTSKEIVINDDNNNSNNASAFLKTLYCHACKLELKTENPVMLIEHKNTKLHIMNMDSIDKNEQSELPCINRNCSAVYRCFTCEINFCFEKDLYLHYNEETHQFRINVLHELSSNKYIDLSDTKFHFLIAQCTLCKVQLNGIKSIYTHNYGLKHRTNLKKVLSITDLNSKSNLVCYICEKDMSDFILTPELKSNTRIESSKKIESIISSSQSEPFACQDCQESFSTAQQLIDHFCNGSKHLKHDQRIASINVNKNKNINNNMNKKEDSSILKGANINENENEIHIYTTIFAEKNLKLRRPRRIFNSEEIGQNYIEKCIEPNVNNIYNLDANSKYKLRLGVSLSFPVETVKRFCIPCNKEISSSNLEVLNNHLHDKEHEKKITELVLTDKPHSADINDCVNSFRLACSYMKESSEETVLCFACLTKIENINGLVYSHMRSKAHIDNCQPFETSSEMIFQNLTKVWQNTWYFAEKFVCDICDAEFESEIDFATHLMENEHADKSKNAGISKSYICIYCRTYWYSEDNLYAAHCKDSLHKRIMESKDFEIPSFADDVERILNRHEATIDSLVRDCDNVNVDFEDACLRLFEMAMRDEYPATKAYLYGPRLSRTNADSTLDIDIYLDCDNAYREFSLPEKNQASLLDIYNFFNNYEKVLKVDFENGSLKVLVDELHYQVPNLRVGIQCGNGLVVEKSKLIRYFAENYPDCKKLILFFKKWMILCQLSGEKAIFTDNAISILVIFYLQTQNCLPSLFYLIRKKNKSNIVAGWEIGYFPGKVDLREKEQSIKNHLSRLFNFYAEFNYITDVICPFLGKPIPKKDLATCGGLPKEMNIYKDLCKRGKAEVFRVDSPMCVQDPIELSANLTAVVTKMQLRMFRQYCLESRNVLDKTAD